MQQHMLYVVFSKEFLCKFFFCIFTGYDMTKYTDNHTCANRQWKSTMKQRKIIGFIKKVPITTT